ncbi:nitrate reductase molybdenum cofactor assembly chaperone [Streptomyces sp. TRM66268-LWL]|uniref:Nitrate reductase molybdenum cofactor assembly chaperone n=1 Tax=Streptomyces polyasparticus TaxID=2767826 RepID=A0ABR7SPG4_9ACTN|nr:nitrate reductase molybdenum cofactor assembly chaperone [Streptomyces polyasparticus]MBC9717381.1 nitrate reductase molybdenum cofactor assembly chaperone [Streptomyces polyasparticus]
MTSPRDAAVICQAASLLLQYPDDTVRDRLPLVAAAVAGLRPGTSHTALTTLLDHIATAPPRQLAEHYVALLDRRRRCCLYLTWWADGETRRRGQALADLKARYRRAGLELDGRELPDHLPVVLEYAATGDLADGLMLLQEHRAGLELLRLALREAGSPYAAAVAAVCALLPGPSPQDRAAARRLARQGPPSETVGLDPYPAPEPGGARR